MYFFYLHNTIDMGAQTSKTSQVLIDRLVNQLESAGYSSADCSAVQTNRIKFTKSTNCNISGQNKCVADAAVDAAAMADAMKKVAQEASTDQEMSGVVLGQFNTNITEITTITNRINEIQQECESKSSVELDQYNEIIAGECKNADIVLLQGGNAQASCMLRQVQQDFVDAEQTSKSKMELEGINLALSGLCFVLPCIILSVLMAGMGGGEGGGGSGAGGGMGGTMGRKGGKRGALKMLRGVPMPPQLKAATTAASFIA